MKTGKIIMIAMAAALAIFALGCSASFSTAKIEDAIMTDSIDENGAPGEEVVSYPADASMLYASAKVRNAPDNTQIRIVWTYVTGDQKMDEITVDSGTISDRYIYSSYQPSALLPEGNYQVQFFIDDRTDADATVKFVVLPAEGKTSVASDGAYLEDAHMTSYMDASGVPADSITTVPPTGTWYVSAILRNTQSNTIVHFVWYDTTGSVIDSYDFDPQGATDVYISGTLELTTVAPEGQYSVELYLDDATAPAETVTFTVGDITASSAASDVDYTNYTQNEGGFSISYPSDWNLYEMKESNAAAFYPAEYAIDGVSDANTVMVISLPDSAKGYTLDDLMKSWVSTTEKDNLTNYKVIDQQTDTVNGNDVAIYAYSWEESNYTLNTIDFLLVNGNDLYVITFTGTQDDFGTLYPYVEQMVLSFEIL